MFKDIDRSSIILFSAFVLALIISLLAYFFIDNVAVTRIFFFPGRTPALSGETRRLPHQKTREDAIQQFVEELILGPMNINHNRLVPEHTKLLSVMYRRQDTVFLDFSADLVVRDNSIPLSYQEMISGIEMNIKYNFPYVKQIIVAVDGEELSFK